MEFNPEKVLDAAMDVFWCKGYEATSLTNLLEAMELSKSSLYQSFGSKQQLFESCLNRYGNWLHRNMAKELEEASSGFAFIENILASIANTAQLPEGNKGCLMVNSTIEFGQKDPIIAAVIAGNLQPLSKLYIEAVERAQDEGDIPLDADPQIMASYLHVAVGGLRTMIKAGADKESVEGTVNLILKALK
ncbi:MAG: TetR/AcrR family transcriptional regulator [Chloroflexi bacterium]|nr:TetR/AcrR family transcriptional regulator [Chloroflexota bacterium]